MSIGLQQGLLYVVALVLFQSQTRSIPLISKASSLLSSFDPREIPSIDAPIQ